MRARLLEDVHDRIYQGVAVIPLFEYLQGSSEC